MPSLSTRSLSSIVTTRPARASRGPESGSIGGFAFAASPRRVAAGATAPVSGTQVLSLLIEITPSGTGSTRRPTEARLQPAMPVGDGGWALTQSPLDAPFNGQYTLTVRSKEARSARASRGS
jgi:hypothetical protein